ncbi:MAG TPA: YidB family protein [Steroidobacteraceae bacterium]
MSPIAKALLALLAVYAMKNMRRADSAPNQPAGRPGNVNAGLPGGAAGGGGGGLGDLLRGTLGGLLGGAAAGTVLNGGLGGLLKQFQENGQGDIAHSWIGTGPNKTISEGDLASALGGDTLDTLSNQTGMGREDLLSGLSRQLPRFVDQLTPDGRVPSEEEAQRMV